MKKVVNAILFFFLSLPGSLYFNFRGLPIFQAIRLPILIGWNTKIVTIQRGVLSFPNGCKQRQNRVTHT